jgi:dihydroxyacid dehydratase/phosphogluconate dehydratase
MSTPRFRSRDWFAAEGRPDMSALYIKRFMNYGLTPEELISGKPIIGIAQTGSDLTPCNRVHIELAKRVRDGVRDAGGIPMEFPVHPIFENCRRPTAALDRNLAAVGGGLSWLRTGDVIRIDLRQQRCDALVDAGEIARRKTEAPPAIPESHSPWEEIYRMTVSQLDTGAVIELAVKYRGISAKTPRHNH